MMLIEALQGYAVQQHKCTPTTCCLADKAEMWLLRLQPATQYKTWPAAPTYTVKAASHASL